MVLVRIAAACRGMHHDPVWRAGRGDFCCADLRLQCRRAAAMVNPTAHFT
jgi:hypothetical protein